MKNKIYIYTPTYSPNFQDNLFIKATDKNKITNKRKKINLSFWHSILHYKEYASVVKTNFPKYK